MKQLNKQTATERLNDPQWFPTKVLLISLGSLGQRRSIDIFETRLIWITFEKRTSSRKYKQCELSKKRWLQAFDV